MLRKRSGEEGEGGGGGGEGGEREDFLAFLVLFCFHLREGRGGFSSN